MKTDKDADRDGGLWSKLTAVTPSPQATAAVAFALLLVVSGVGPFAGLGGLAVQDHDGVASAATGEADYTVSVGGGTTLGSSGPTVVNGVAYLASETSNEVIAIDLGTQTEKWRTSTTNTPDGAVHVVDGVAYLTDLQGEVYALDTETGDVIWQKNYGTSYMASSPTLVDGTLYVSSSDGNLYALNPDDGTTQWTYSGTGEVRSSSPTVSNGNVFVGDMDGVLHAVDKDTGDVNWTSQIGDGSLGIMSSPTVYEGLVFAGTQGNTLKAFNISTGDTVWTAAGARENTPTISNGILYTQEYDGGSQSGWFHAYDAKTGDVVWNKTLDEALGYSSPTVAGSSVYISTNAGNVYAYDKSTGTQEWSYSGGGEQASPIVVDGTLYTYDSNGVFHAVDTGTTATSDGSRVSFRTLNHHASTQYDGHPISGTVTDNGGDPVDGATVSTDSGVSTTTGADGSYELTVSETGTYDVTASARGYQDTTETVDVPDGGTTQDFSLTESDAPFVGSFNPNDGASLETSQVSLEAELRSHDGHDLNYTIYHRDTESEDNFTALKTGQVADGTVVSTTVSDASGTNEWFVRLSDGTTTTDTEVFNYTAPGSLSFYDRETESLINDREITVEMRPAFGAWEGTTLTTTDGVVNFDDVDRDAGKVWAVFMNTTGYNSTFWTLSDVEHNHNVMLRPKGSNIETFNQTFALDDETGDYPPRTSTIELEQYYLGEYQRQDIDNFGQENRANLTVEPNTTYRIKVYNTNGNYRVLGEYNSSNANRDGVITVHVNPIEEVPERFPPGNEDTTQDWENEDDYNSPPVADFSSNPLDPTIGESVSFDGSLSADFDGSISSYEWQFGDGTTATGASVSHSYGSAGTYTVELTVTDDAGLKATTSRTIYVAEDSSSTRLPPTAEFETAPAEPNVSEVVNLDASASTSDAGSIASVEWDLNGNGEFTESGTSIDHKFETSGFKRVCVRVTDDAGVSSETCDTLVVFDDSPPGNASEGSFGGGGGGGGGIGGGPVDDPTGGNPLLVGGVLVGVALLIARRTGNLSKITGAASGLLRAGVSGVRRLVGVVRR
jgi:outer membrane protein assembly factor BamB/PKD repeat protein